MNGRGRAVVQVAALGALAALVVAGALRLRLGGEALTDLAVGRLLAASGAVPPRDTLSWSAGATPWIAESWLGQLLAFEAWRAGGFRVVALLHLGLLAAATAAVTDLVRRRTAGLAAAPLSLGVLGALLATVPPCTEGWSVLLLAVVLCFAERLRRAPGVWPAAGLGAAAVASARLDAGFVAVFAALAVALAASVAERSWARARLLAAALVAGVASFALHPAGFAALAHPLDHLLEPRLREVFWNVPGLGGTDFTSRAGRIVEAPLLLVLGLALGRRFKPRLEDALLVLLFAHAALTCERAVPFFVVAAAGPLAGAIEEALRGAKEPGRLFVRGAPLALLAGLLAGGAAGSPHLLDDQRDALAVAERLAAIETPGELWNELGTGGALAWGLDGRRRIWLDARHDLFAAAGVWRKHVTIVAARAPWEDLVDRTHTNLAVVTRDSPIDEALRARGWRAELETPSLSLLVRH